ncbi:hypothetical protein GCM10022408_28110 [Hymenobacter fastidiosus]|uniref:Fibronectin type-III domain-containing protein n=1 Tax=Hymenobacter fastidiosus TaxID=486264 RepID=A0ABP7SLS2_9BACT
MKKILPYLWLVLLGILPRPAAHAQSSAPLRIVAGRVVSGTLPPAAQQPAVAVSSPARATAAVVWNAVASIPVARAQHAAEVVGNKIYVWGGYVDGGSVPISSMSIYDVATNTWSAGANCPISTRGQAHAVGANGLLYSMSGASANGALCSSYNPATNTWAAIANIPTPVWEARALTGLDGKIYVLGGEGNDSGLQIYNPTTNTWSTGATMPTGSKAGTAAIDNNGRLHVIGGVNAGYGLINPHNVYTPATNTWTTAAAMPAARAQAGSVLGSDGQIYVVGGKNSATNLNTPVYSEVYVYNVGTDTWTTSSNLPTALGELKAVRVGGDIYSIAGQNGVAQALVYRAFISNVAPTVTTAAASAIASTSATLGGNVTNDGGSPVTERGVVYSTTNATPTTADTKATNGTGGGSFSATVSGLTPGTTYNVRAYAINSLGTSYGSVITFTTTAAATATSWTGAVSTDWFTAGNWTAGVPTTALDATIPASAPRMPAITAGTASVKTLTLNSGSSLTQTSGTLDVRGDLTSNGTFQPTGGTVVLGSSTLASLSGSSGMRFWNLTVNASGAQLSTAASTAVQRLLTLNGNLATQGNAFTLESNSATTAMVVNNGSAVVNGTSTVQRYLDPSLNAGLGYRHYSSPVVSTAVSDLATGGFTPVVNNNYNSAAVPGATTPFPTVFGYDESRITAANATTLAFEQGYFSPAALSTPLTLGRGYTVNLAASEKVALTGALNTGTVPVGALSRGSEANSGWQLLGNPYPAPLDWNVARTGLPTGVQDAIYVYKSSDQYNGTYQFYTNGFGSLPGGLIGSMQGFFVRVSQPVPSFSFQNSWRTTTYQNPTFNRPTADTRPSVQLELVSAQGAHEPTYVYFEQGATAGFDTRYDAEKLVNTTGLNLSSSAAGTPLAINGLPLFTATTTVPLNVGVPVTGTYTLTAASLANLGTTDVYLHDALTDRQINLKQQPSYIFSASNAALITGRFTLNFGPMRPTATQNGLTAASVSLYPNPAHKSFTLLVPAVRGESQAKLTLYNVLGQAVRTAAVALPAAGAQTTMDVQGLPLGVYVLRVKAGATTVIKQVVVN